MPELKQNRRYTVGGGKWAGLTFADEAARTSFEPLATGAGVIALQQDTGQYYLLESVDTSGPSNVASWAEVSIAPSAAGLESPLSYSAAWASPGAVTQELIAVGELPYDLLCIGAWANIDTQGTGSARVRATSTGPNLGDFDVATATGGVLDSVGDLVGKTFDAATEGLFLNHTNGDSTGSLTLLFTRA